ncbi:MAG: zinc-ribbon domain-containing protein [Candidatus Bathyarchaeota archaeon]|nr:MAG: zinc-ribbon domain-containing protein [Candidatus Bathyarchaeota archaeon]
MPKKKYLSKDKIIGKQVINPKAMIVGSIKNLSFDPEKKEVAFSVTTKEGKEMMVTGSEIDTVGDVVLLKKQMNHQPATPTKTAKSTSPGLCSMCNFQNDSTAKFCIKCGAKVQ